MVGWEGECDLVNDKKEITESESKRNQIPEPETVNVQRLQDWKEGHTLTLPFANKLLIDLVLSLFL